MSDRIESVRLDALDGFQFEELCGRIFEKLDLGKVTYVGHTADEGRDLILEGYKGRKAIVECKHQPNSGIGRPIVQKLHSATIEENAQYAIVVTTGHFTKDAVEYAEKLRSRGVTVELFDFPILNDMAQRAGIRLLQEGQSFPIHTFYVSNPAALSVKIANAVFPRMISAPLSPSAIASIEPRVLELRTGYLIQYNIHENFDTTIGRVHSVHHDNQLILVDGSTGGILDPNTSEWILSSKRTNGIHSGYPGVEIRRYEFRLDLQTITKKAKQHIIKLHTRTVGYRGGNNVHYNKTCRPGERSIFISSTTQVYYPYWRVSIKALRHEYQLDTIENHNHIHIVSTNIANCSECGQVVKEHEKALFCNSCGAVVHQRSSHGFICRNCSKTICRSCAYWTRRWLLLKKKICEPCADQLASRGKKKRKLPLTRHNATRG